MSEDNNKMDLITKLHEHDIRINSIEIKHEDIILNVSDLKSDRKRVMWLVITILVSGLVYAGLSGLEGIINVVN